MTTRSRQPAGTADDYEQQQREEWTKYVARVPIDYYGVRAYNVGDPVPVSAVGEDPAAGRWVRPEYVDERTAFEGSTTVVSSEPPTVDPATVAAPVVSSTVDPSTVTSSEG